MQQPEWPIDLVRTDHCNRLLFVLNETYFHVGAPTQFNVSHNDQENSSDNSESHPDLATSTTDIISVESHHSVTVNVGNFLYLCLGMILGILLYTTLWKVGQQIYYLRDCIKQTDISQTGPKTSTAFYYVATMPISTRPVPITLKTPFESLIPKHGPSSAVV